MKTYLLELQRTVKRKDTVVVEVEAESADQASGMAYDAVFTRQDRPWKKGAESQTNWNMFFLRNPDQDKEIDYWGEHPDHPAEDWRLEVANGDTRMGYWEWAKQRDCEN